MRNRISKNELAHGAFVFLGWILLLSLVSRVWIVFFISLAITLFLIIKSKLKKSEDNTTSISVIESPETRCEEDWFAVILKQINEQVKNAYPDAKWVWRNPNARKSIEAGEEVMICLNKAAGYKFAKVIISDLTVQGLDFTVNVKGNISDETETEDEELSRIPRGEDNVNYDLLAYEWVQDNILLLIQEANTREAYLKNNERIAYENIYYYPDDEKESIYTYQDANRYVYEDSYSLLVADSEGIYGKYGENEQVYRMLLVGENALDEYMLQCPISWYTYSETEQIESMSVKRGVLSIKSLDKNVDEMKEYLEECGYDIGDIQHVCYEYKVDAFTFELLKIEVSAMTDSGESIPISKLSRVKRCKEYKEDKKMLENIFAGEQVKFTVIADASTNEEMIYEQSISKNGEFFVFMLPEYEQKFFANPEYTEEVSFDSYQFEEDTILYVKHPDKILIAENAEETDEITLGIDVSKFQGTIDWAKVANSGIDFAMIRIGYRSEESGEIKEDNNARFNMQEATKHGLKIGAYFFSTAISAEEAVEEAVWVSDYISQYAITYPVVYDCENYESPKSRQYELSKTE